MGLLFRNTGLYKSLYVISESQVGRTRTESEVIVIGIILYDANDLKRQEQFTCVEKRRTE